MRRDISPIIRVIQNSIRLQNRHQTEISKIKKALHRNDVGLFIRLFSNHLAVWTGVELVTHRANVFLGSKVMKYLTGALSG